MASTIGVTMAELANVFIMIAALVAFFIMLVLLLRNMAVVGVIGEGEVGPRPAWRGVVQPPRLLMQRVHIPFTFKIEDSSKASYTGVLCSISSTVRYERACWWGAPVRELHTALWAPLRDLLETDRLAKHCSSHTPLVRSTPHKEKTIQLKLESSLHLGAPPRTCYPLVVVLARDLQDIAELRPDDTVALVSVVHIKDDSCTLPSGVLAQYLKQANGQLSCLKQLYVSSKTDGEEAYGGARHALCCVCASRPLSRALLPCRHACLCADCFPKLDKCPICRSGISSYFCIRSEEEPSDKPRQPASWSLNQRLLHLLPQVDLRH